jgi:hypothetical protein
MPCTSCLSSNQAEFPAEINFHFRGPENWTRPAVWVFPRILVCLDCGASRFATPENELARLTQTDQAATGVAA